MTIIPPIPPYTLPSRPLTQIQPFTTRSAVTYALKLEELQFYVTETLVTFITENFAGLGDEFETEVNRLLTEVAAALEAQNTSVDERIVAMDERLTTAVDELTLYVNTKVQEIIDGSVEVADAVTADVFLNDDSATREVTDMLYAGLDVFNTLANIVGDIPANYATKATQTLTETGRLSESELDASYALKSVETAVVSGRLSEASLNDSYAAKSVQTLVETGRLSESALDLSYAPLNISNTYALRPLANAVPAGTLFYATDVPEMYRSNGVAWTVIGSGGNELGSAQRTENMSGITSTTFVSVPGMTTTFKVGERPIEITVTAVADVGTGVKLLSLSPFLDGIEKASAVKVAPPSGYAFHSISRTQRVSGLTPGSSHTVDLRVSVAGSGASGSLYGDASSPILLTVKTL